MAHMATREYILTVLVLHSVATSLVLTQNESTYLRELPSGRKVLCERCPPGSHLLKHCTETQRTACQPCGVGFYTKYWNYIHDCLPCNWCSSDQVMTQECTKTSNRVCRCKEGFFWDSYFCRPHTVCSKGYRVKEKGTSDRDTVCELCKNGSFTSGQPGNTRCVPHTWCKAEEKLLFHGNSYVDNVCVTCSNIRKADGWVKLIEQPFIEIIKNQSSRRLHRLVRHLKKTVCIFRPDMDYEVGMILQLQQWFSVATEEQVFSLPKLLNECGMKNLATKIEHRVKRIIDEISLCKDDIN